MMLCACGCGDVVLPHFNRKLQQQCRYLHGHNKGKQKPTIADIQNMFPNIDGCWEWPYALTSEGYAVIRRRGRNYRLTRILLEETLGRALLPKHFACHHCDNRKCIRPDHLFEGTNEDNMLDCVRKGRSPSAKLTASRVRSLRQLHAEGFSVSLLARLACITKGPIYALLNKQTWKHVQ